MRHLILLVLLAAGMVAFSAGLSAQALKNEAKPDAKSAPGAEKKEKKEKKEFEWPKEVGGKKLEYWVKEISKSPDASNREAAIRLLPQFGPDARNAAGPALFTAMTKDADVSVRLAAMAAIPVVGLDEANFDPGLNAIVALLKPSNGHDKHTRLAAVETLAACGPVANRASAIPTLVEFTCKDPTSWQLRKAAAAALASIGRPIPTEPPQKDGPATGNENPGKSGKENPGKPVKENLKLKLQSGGGPDLVAVKCLMRMLSPTNEHCHQVRRQAMQSLMALGPPHDPDVYRLFRKSLEDATKDPDEKVSIWAHAFLVSSDTKGIKPNDPNTKFLVESMSTSDPSKRMEILTAIGALGDTLSNRVIDDIIALATSIQKDKELKDIKFEELVLTCTAIQVLAQMPSQMSKSLPVLDKLESHKIEAIKQSAEYAHKYLMLQQKDREKMNLKAPKIEK